MSLHLVSVRHLEAMPTNAAKALVREETIARMGEILKAGYDAGIDLDDEVAAADYLQGAPEDYPAKVVWSHLDDALFEARQAVLAEIFSR